MKRRNFIRNAAVCAVAVSTSGFVRFNGRHFEGDCETTTDILGPFYRPDAPLRSDMRIANAKGQLVVLSGQVKHKDCTTPLKNACVEIWHCDGSGVYDNDSPDYRYRAKTFCDDSGNYRFDTIIPVPYDAGGGVVRPAHFHMMFSAEGYQSLITQLYFTGDKYLAKDASSASPSAKKRILNIKEGAGGDKSVLFNVTMLDNIPADPAVIQRLAGTYINTADSDKKQTFYKRDALLWIENPSSINGGYPLLYVGNNSFKPYGREDINLLFSPESNGAVKLLYTKIADDHTKETWESVKAK